MSSQLVLHARTKQNVDDFVQNPSHNLLLIGPEGSGKPTLAHNIIAQALELPVEKLNAYPYFMQVTPVKGTISIEAVRNLQDFVKLKTTGTQTLRRAIVVEDAHTMTTEARNAFLKLLEEPPTDTLIILTAQGNDSLLPTILSRAPKIMLKTPSQKELTAYFTQNGYDETEITKSFFISRGQVGLIQTLLQKDSEDERLQYIDDAKQFLQAKTFERLVMADQFTKQKKDTKQLLWALQRVGDSALHQAAKKGSNKQVVYWKNVLDVVVKAQDSLNSNPQSKLLLTNLSLQI
jgi:DNA polymerase III delta prime subunit